MAEAISGVPQGSAIGHASSEHAGLAADNLGRDQKGVTTILGFPNVKCSVLVHFFPNQVTAP